MRSLLNSLIIGFCFLFFLSPAPAQPAMYPWLQDDAVLLTLGDRISPPKGFEREEVRPASFDFWLQCFPVKSGNPPVMLFDGGKKGNQSAHHLVLDLDVGNKDLQQCADSVIRLWAEYLYFTGQYNRIHFNFTSGDRADFTRWAEGYRPVVQGSKVSWVQKGDKGNSYEQFRAYLENVMMYAGSASLSKEMIPVEDMEDIRAGDVFIQGGFPGHAVIVMDTAVHPKTGEKVFLLAQGFMPAQDMHVLKNLNHPEISPWYKTNFGQILSTPEWDFAKTDLKRFPPQ
ncbi:DUF4846 domain-containing protein [Desulfatibacillum aliphaticivorans]|uniref:DUF4846 domain-containing protein n=1 Tax=Desulfatibacillum aliphaticivorans TaxID=218208 RepID=UPI00041D4D66|nr:DUF4846 domain-containing protein [Desulfatibacillum aliphaticivorans]